MFSQYIGYFQIMLLVVIAYNTRKSIRGVTLGKLAVTKSAKKVNKNGP